MTGSLGLEGGSPASAGGAVDRGGSPSASFSTSHIDLNWFTTSTNDLGIFRLGRFTLGRFTLTDNAVVTFTLRLDSLGQASPFLLTGIVHNGYLTAVPEASTLVLSGMSVLATVAFVRLRRKSSRTV